jgi:hypothetical protein
MTSSVGDVAFTTSAASVSLCVFTGAKVMAQSPFAFQVNVNISAQLLPTTSYYVKFGTVVETLASQALVFKLPYPQVALLWGSPLC